MKHKKGIELSINFLVVIILGLAMLGMAVLFFTKFFAGARTIQASYDQQTEEELNAMLIAGKKVAIPFTRIEVKPGETAVFGLGILSIIPAQTDFGILVKCDMFVREDGTVDGSCPLAESALYPDSKTLQNNEHVSIPIAISTNKDADAGTYVYDLCVCKDMCSDCPPVASSELYDESSHKLYVKVL